VMGLDVDHAGLLVSDIDRSIECYERVHGLERARRPAGLCRVTRSPLD
jgi:catechol 2,3-dioxygenase-like lactoylglutathione lyase family enzyme